MSLYALLGFALIYALAVATPGPGIAAVIARALGRGAHGAPAFIGGFLAGDLIWFTLAAFGLAVLAQRAHTVFVVVRFAGAAYLLYLAWRLWRAPPGTFGARAAAPPESNLQVFLGSLALTLGNPKTMVFFLAVLPAVLGAYTLFATRARERLSQPRTVRWLQRGTGAVLAGAAVAVAARS